MSETPRPPRTSGSNALAERIIRCSDGLQDELIAFRRDMHSHPELARGEKRATEAVARRLRAAGLRVALLPGTGLYCDIDASTTGSTGSTGSAAGAGGRVVLRADLDALPLLETSGLEFAATNGYAHACGHDIHTASALGAGLILAELAAAGELARDVRLVFQPAEEVQPGGALDVIEVGALDGVSEVYALHCDPRVDVGAVATRVGPITSTSDTVTVTLTSRGGHTSRPHRTGDLVYALGQIITAAPAVLARRIDPRFGVNLTWGSVHAGTAANAIPARGTVTGTLRCLDSRAWDEADDLLMSIIPQLVAATGVHAEVDLVRGVPAVVNTAREVDVLEASVRTLVGEDATDLTDQSLGGEDFGWYLRHRPGAMGRLGTRSAGGRTYDLHQGDAIFDEGAIGVGARVLAGVAALPRAGRTRYPEPVRDS
ncbi:amidohydrolase [Pseudactinotalea sp. HY160]|uniref:amidohydrolase n=1 Tax=Pseudactinotalea sp. HY160 TaxID=2654490 RepID=UPI00128AEDA1|nr:amidohydrolase [Pseudactinotalea sp. HY160]MPV51118.1 amidohydrolase [Pseudactinotalea sp. HY160]